MREAGMLSSCAIRGATPSLRRSLAPASNLPIHPRRRGQLVRHVCIARAWAVGREGGALVSSPPSALENDLAFDGALALVGARNRRKPFAVRAANLRAHIRAKIMWSDDEQGKRRNMCLGEGG